MRSRAVLRLSDVKDNNTACFLYGVGSCSRQREICRIFHVAFSLTSQKSLEQESAENKDRPPRFHCSEVSLSNVWTYFLAEENVLGNGVSSNTRGILKVTWPLGSKLWRRPVIMDSGLAFRCFFAPF